MKGKLILIQFNLFTSWHFEHYEKLQSWESLRSFHAKVLQKHIHMDMYILSSEEVKLWLCILIFFLIFQIIFAGILNENYPLFDQKHE